jgi:RHS repeat-associated protein
VQQYVYGRGIDDPLTLDRDEDGDGQIEARLFYHDNGRNHIVALTDENGRVVERTSYDAFGRPTWQDANGQVLGTRSSPAGNPFLFTGRRFDPEAGLYYFRARTYHPELGRFLQRDPMGMLRPDEMSYGNAYTYAGNNPISWRDPMGLLSLKEPLMDFNFTPPGFNFLPRGLNYFPRGLNYLPQGFEYLPQGKEYLPQGFSYLPQGKEYLPQGKEYLPQGKEYLPQGKEYLPQGLNYFPPGGAPRCPGQKEYLPPMGKPAEFLPSPGSARGFNFLNFAPRGLNYTPHGKFGIGTPDWRGGPDFGGDPWRGGPSFGGDPGWRGGPSFGTYQWSGGPSFEYQPGPIGAVDLPSLNDEFRMMNDESKQKTDSSTVQHSSFSIARSEEALGLNVLRLSLLPSEIPPDKRDLVVMAGRATYYAVTRRVAEAGKAFRELIARYPDTPNVHYAYGVFLLQEDPDAALKEFRRELEITPEHVLARLQIAFEYLKRGDSAAALPLAEQAVQLAPNWFAPHLALGYILLGTGDTARAIQELEASVKLAPDSPALHFALARAYARAGRKDAAARERATFLRLDAMVRTRRDGPQSVGGVQTSSGMMNDER